MEMKVEIKTLTVSLLMIALALSLTLPATTAQKYLFSFHIQVRTGLEEEYGIAEVMKEELSKIGIELVIDKVDSAAQSALLYGSEYYKTYEEGGWDMVVMGFSWKATGALWWEGCWSTSGLPPGGWNFVGLTDGKIDALLREGMEVYDFEKRKEIYNEFQERFMEEAMAIPIFWRVYVAIMDSNLKGYDVNLQTFLWKNYKWTYNKDTVKFAINWDPGDLMPLWYDGNTWFIGPIYSSLMRQMRTPEGKYTVAPDLAVDYPTISEDGLTLNFTLRDDVKWHDGVPFTSADVKFTIDLITNKETGSILYGDLAPLIKSVETPDDYHVTIHLTKKNAEVLTFLSNYHCDILPKHILENIPPKDLKTSKYNTIEPVIGTGPYKFVSYKEGTSFELEANPDYYGGSVGPKHLILPIIPEAATALAAVESHDIDIVSWSYGASFVPEMARLQKKTDITAIASFDRPGFKWIGINLHHPILQNKLVRQAIAYSIPYDRICKDVMLGLVQPANSLVPPSHPFYNEKLPNPYYTYDLAKAAELLRKAGYTWPPPEAPETPLSAYILPAVGGIAVGIAIGAIVVYFVHKRKES